MSELGLDGVIAFPVTPMDDEGEQLDLPAYEKLISWLADSGCRAIVPMGSTGEYAYLRERERREITTATVDTLGGRAAAIIGVSALSTREAVENARHAARAGAQGIMLSIPTYYRLSAREVEAHVRAVAGGSDLPLILYNNPFTSLVDLTADLLHKLADLDTLVAVKEATTDVNRIPALRAALPERVKILGGGFDPYALPAFCMGATGWTTGMANLVPERCVALHRAAVIDRDLPTAQRLSSELAPLAGLLMQFGLSVAVKAGLRLLGRPVGAPRRPLLPLAEDDERRLAGALTALGLMP